MGWLGLLDSFYAFRSVSPEKVDATYLGLPTEPRAGLDHCQNRLMANTSSRDVAKSMNPAGMS